MALIGPNGQHLDVNMTWFAFNGYQDINAGGAEEKELVAAGFHGYGTQSEADAHKNSVNVFQGMLLDSLHLAHDTTGQAINAGQSIGGGVSSAISSVPQFLQKLSEGNLWLRIGEFILGIVLIGLGLGKLTGLDSEIAGAAKGLVKV